MAQRAKQHNNMQNLMTSPPNVERPRKPALGHPSRIDAPAGDIQQSKSEKVRQRRALVLHGPAVQPDAVGAGQEGGQAEGAVEEEAELAAAGPAEALLQCCDCAAEGGEGGLWLFLASSEGWVAVEAEVIARDHRSPHDQDDAKVVHSKGSERDFRTVVPEDEKNIPRAIVSSIVAYAYRGRSSWYK
ncbi:hypothetical protein LTR50_004437 [Elasticomyces elasticus]|nr:hypothetical protein LTR50_004437 [Elasticomyces elasticus]